MIATASQTVAGAPPDTAVASSSARAAWLLLAPFLIGFAVFYVAPIVVAVVKSFTTVTRTSTYGRPTEVFAGFGNYTAALGDDGFTGSLGRVLLFGAIQIPVMLGLALVLALALDSAKVRLRRFFRLAFFLPYAVPGVIAAVMWGFFYAPNLSPINQLLDPLGIQPDLLSGNVILYSIANIVTWTFTGYNMLILYSSLQAIPPQLYEAARLDGASGWAIAWRIKVPIIAPSLVLTGVFSIIGTFQLFTEPQVMAGVSSAVSSSYTPSMAAYAQISAQNHGLGAAMSVLVTLVIAVLSLLFFRITRARAAL
ncbi:sugar ABC transporter permease [Amycolatopsis sp. A133]|uniref:carbohydrate ABC transporter permease n=1 Tax=Amycolatopsis sp. A133 TaxID=3064472 RepID=UPI0027EFCA9D|nr:sugar ABC transporter permease [Amycolatopsis sp. A133]MDQ7806436.1 sugar ABC transporter permease [Amycolatopsis sp. A133]